MLRAKPLKTPPMCGPRKVWKGLDRQKHQCCIPYSACGNQPERNTAGYANRVKKNLRGNCCLQTTSNQQPVGQATWASLEFASSATSKLREV